MARAHILRVRASDEEIDHWRALAAAAGVSLSDLVRLSLGRVRPWSPGDRAAAAERTRQVARIGNNLNQVARRVNVAALAGERLAILAALAMIEEELTEMLPDGDGRC